jgi:hypothetical protein
MSMFNTREIASAIWIFAFSIFIFTKGNIRSSLSSVLKALFKIKIIVPFILLFVYIAIIVNILYHFKMWNISLLKDTIIWTLFSATSLSFNSITTKDDEDLFKKLVISSIKIILIFEFILNTYTFSLIIELLLVPIVTIITLLEVMAESREKYKPSHKFLTGIQIILGMLIIISAIKNAISDYEVLGNLETLRSFLLAPVLSIFLFPFIYCLALYSAYEQLFIRLKLGSKKNRKLINYAKRKIIGHCKLRLKKVKAALNMGAYNLMNIQNYEDIDDMLKMYREKI